MFSSDSRLWVVRGGCPMGGPMRIHYKYTELGDTRPRVATMACKTPFSLAQTRYQFRSYEELARRVMGAICGQEASTLPIYRSMLKKQFLPAGNTLYGGLYPITPNCATLGSPSADTFPEAVLAAKALWSTRTGIGIDLSRLKSPVRALRLLSDLNKTTKMEGGSHRPLRGNMATLECSHPEIKSFLDVKKSQNSLWNFNISVKVSDEFMDKERKGDIAAQQLLMDLAQSAWARGDPGVVFQDRLRALPGVSADELAVVPCGEQAMSPYETCNLGSINLAALDLGSPTLGEELEETAYDAALFLDRVIDHTRFSFPRCEEATHTHRRIGLGLMGFADGLAAAGLPYGSLDSLRLAETIAYHVTRGARRAFPQRHATLTCIAPTGGITLLTSNRGYAIEPFFTEANRLHPEDHLNVQAAFQSHIENNISKTINLPSSSGVLDVRDIIRKAWLKGLKSVTVYRDQSQENQPIACSTC